MRWVQNLKKLWYLPEWFPLLMNAHRLNHEDHQRQSNTNVSTMVRALREQTSNMVLLPLIQKQNALLLAQHEELREKVGQMIHAVNLTVTELQRLHEWTKKFDTQGEDAGVYVMSDAKAAQVEREKVRESGRPSPRPPRGLVR